MFPAAAVSAAETAASITIYSEFNSEKQIIALTITTKKVMTQLTGRVKAI